MGTSSQQLNIGTGTNNLEIMGDYNGSWGTRSWDPSSGDCITYDKDVSDLRMISFDERNIP
jgi:hypothetical protein